MEDNRPESAHHKNFKSNIAEQTAIFPIMLRIPEENDRFSFAGLGTGFFISKYGLFVTAKHVVEEDQHYANGKGMEAWIIIDGQNFTCPIIDLDFHPTADIAIGCIAQPRDAQGNRVKGFAISLQKICAEKLNVGDKLFSYGYPRTKLAKDDETDTVTIDMKPYYYKGELLEYHPNGVSIARWPVYRHSVPIASGMSGGPLFHNGTSLVIGVNCTGDSTPTADVEHGTGTDIHLILDMVIKSAIPGFQGKTIKEILVAENLLLSKNNDSAK